MEFLIRGLIGLENPKLTFKFYVKETRAPSRCFPKPLMRYSNDPLTRNPLFNDQQVQECGNCWLLSQWYIRNLSTLWQCRSLDLASFFEQSTMT